MVMTPHELYNAKQCGGRAMGLDVWRFILEGFVAAVFWVRYRGRWRVATTVLFGTAIACTAVFGWYTTQGQFHRLVVGTALVLSLQAFQVAFPLVLGRKIRRRRNSAR